MKESGFWRKLRPLMREAAPGIVVERIESWSTPGFPDVSGCWKGRDFWLELKIGFHCKFRPAQIRWLKRRWDAGSRCFVFIWCPNGGAYLFGGDQAHELSRVNCDDIKSHGVFCLDKSSVRQLLEVVCGFRQV